MDKELKSGFKFGLGIAGALLLIFGIFYTVFAFVEPSSSPSSDYVLNWNSPLNALHSDTNSRVSNVEESLGSVTANSGMYDNRIPANFNPPNDYTMICFKGGSTLNDQMDGGDSTNDGVNCAVGDVGFIIEANERSALHWENAKAVCLEEGMRLPEPFEFKHACNNAGTFGLTSMTGNWEWVSNFALPMYDTTFRVTAALMSESGCGYATFGSIGSSDGTQNSHAFRCVK